MVSNFDRLRQGEAIEFKPGLSGRLNPQNKTLELSSGEVLDASRNRDLFPSNEQELAFSRSKESVRKGIKGPVSEFWHQYSTQGVPGGIKDMINYAGKDYANKKAAEMAVSEEISEESPYISGAATAANIATDLALTRGMSAAKAASLLTGLSAGSDVITNPGEVAFNAVGAAAGGKLLDVGMNYVNKVAARRGAAREIPAKQASVRAQNVAGEQNVASQNLAQQQAYEAQKKAIEDRFAHETEQAIQTEAARQAEIVRIKNLERQAKAKRSGEEATYKQQREALEAQADVAKKKYELDVKNYEAQLKNLPKQQKEAQKVFSQDVIKNAEGIATSFPKDAKIYTSQFGVSQFIEDSIQKSGLATSKEATRASKFLKTLFPDGEILTAKEIGARYKAMEEYLVKSGAEGQGIINSFKNHLSERLPAILADTMAYQRLMPSLQKQITNEVEKAFLQLPKPLQSEFGNIKSDLGIIFKEITPENFIQNLQSGQLKQKLASELVPVMPAKNIGGKAKGFTNAADQESVMARINEIKTQERQAFLNTFMPKIDKILSNAELKTFGLDVDAAKKLGSKVKGTLGTAPEVTPPPQPSMAQTPPIPPQPNFTAIPPTQIPPPMPAKPMMGQLPPKPTPQQFTPVPEPTLPPPQGFAEKAGDFLESNPLTSGRTMLNNPLTKLGGLKYLLGGGAKPALAGYAALKGLTSPTTGGQVARMTFKQGGIQAIETWMQNYPSYHDGILESPQDRRSMTKELEEAADIPIEMKAVLQSKINRGKPLDQKL